MLEIIINGVRKENIMNNLDLINKTPAIDRSTLRNIQDVVIDTTKPCAERIRSFIDQIGNPYCYLDNGIVVEIGYADTSVSLHERLLSYANNINSSGNLL